jgi:hypothetical protein
MVLFASAGISLFLSLKGFNERSLSPHDAINHSPARAFQALRSIS